MSSQLPFHYQELASIRVRGLHIIRFITPQNLVTKADYQIVLSFMSSRHPFHCQELASITARGLHNTHPITQQNWVTKVDY